MSLLFISPTKYFFPGITGSCRGLDSSPRFPTSCVNLGKLLTLSELQSPGLLNVDN